MTFSQRSRIPAGILAFAATMLFFTALTFVLVGCGGTSATTSITASSATTTTSGSGGTTTSSVGGGGNNVQVAMVNRSYDPATVTIRVGDTVTWANQSSIQHDVVADNGEFKSKLFGQGETFSFTFAKAGTFPYHCSIHPGMTGTVIVQ